MFGYIRTLRGARNPDALAFELRLVIPWLSWLVLPGLTDPVGFFFSVEWWAFSMLAASIVVLRRMRRNPSRPEDGLPISEYLARLRRIQLAGFLPWLVWALWTPDSFWRQALRLMDPPASYWVSGALLGAVVVLALAPPFPLRSVRLVSLTERLASPPDPPGWLLGALAILVASGIAIGAAVPAERFKLSIWILASGLLAPGMGWLFSISLRDAPVRRMTVWFAAITTVAIVLVSAPLLGTAGLLLALLAAAVLTISWARSKKSAPSGLPEKTG
jgi:hypothetical protein